MNTLHRIFASLVIVLLAMQVTFAQEGMSITEDIKEVMNDLDARQYHTVIDQNGKKCALIKIYTSADNLSFDTGSLGVVKSEQKKSNSEWWVYVPEDTQKLKITHAQYGQLNTNDGYYYFKPLKAATVYRLELRTPQVDALEKIDSYGFLILETDPNVAQVSIVWHDEEIFNGNTPLQMELHYGEYTYTLSGQGYHEKKGRVVIDKDHVLVKESLVPLISESQTSLSGGNGRLRITTYPYFAEISVNNTLSGTTPRTLQLPVGEYDVMLSKQGYDTLYRHVAIVADSLTLIDEQLSVQEGVTISTEAQVTDVEFEEIQAELIERRKKQKERLKLLSTPIQPRFEQMMLIDFTLGGGKYLGDTDISLGLNYIAGYRSNALFIGAGVGVLYDFSGSSYHYDPYYYLLYNTKEFVNGSKYQFPLFAHMRVYFTGGKPVQFYMGASIGYIFEQDAELEREIAVGEYEYIPFNASSLFVSPGLGINIRLSSKVGLDISASYYGRNAIDYSELELIYNRWASGIKINLGITF